MPLLGLELVAGQTPDDAFRQKMQFSDLLGPENVENDENNIQTNMKMHETSYYDLDLIIQSNANIKARSLQCKQEKMQAL